MNVLRDAWTSVANLDWTRIVTLAVVVGMTVFWLIKSIGKAASITTQVVRVLLGAILLGLVAIIMLPTDQPKQWIVLGIVSLGLLAIGTIIGFLFGLPKSLDPDARGNASVTPGVAPQKSPAESPTQSNSFVRFLQTNNNLQKVSDWLTTVITGLTLTQLVKIPQYVWTFGTFLKVSLGGLHYGVAIGAGALLYFPSAGFAAGYLITRLVLTGEFDRTERALAEGDQRQVSDATSGDFKLFSDLNPEPTSEQIDAATRISQIPLSSLTTGDEKAAWARAQSILKNWSNAILAFQQAIVLRKNDVSLLEDYANALYEWGSPPADVIAVLDRALALAQDPYAKARIIANKTLAFLDANNYQAALDNIGRLLNDPTLPKRARYFLYRARANGMKYAALSSASPGDSPLENIADEIVSDTKLAINLDPNLRVVAREQAQPASSQAPEGDLYVFASQNPDYRTLIGM